MKVNLTDEQILQLATNAVNASVPVGMGFMHFEDTEYSPNDLKPHLNENRLSIDYFNGRMVKLNAIKKDDEWVFPDRDPTVDYQSWCSEYLTYQNLIDSVL